MTLAHKKIHTLLTSLLLCLGISANAQELNCRVEVNASQISGTQSTFETLQQAITEYMNSTTFSNAQFSPGERIDCQIFLTVKEYADGIVKGDLQVQSTRPVYNSAYTTTLINFKDSKIDFEYQEGEPLVYSVNNMENQLTAILNFYAFLFLAVDFDSFSPRGGDPYFERLKMIVQQGQSSGEIGWKAFEDNKNRAAVVSAFTDNTTSGIRDLVYQYHRQGLDQMAVSPEKGRMTIHKSLPELKKVYDVQPMSVALSMFKDAKLEELVNIYSKATADERKEAYDLLQPLYPAEADRLEKIRLGDQKK